MQLPNFLLQIFDDRKFGIDSCLEEEIELVKPIVPISKINPNFSYKLWTIIRNKETKEIVDYNQYAGEIRFSND